MKTVFKQIDMVVFLKAMKHCLPEWNIERDRLSFYFDDKTEGYIDANGRAYWKEEA